MACLLVILNEKKTLTLTESETMFAQTMLDLTKQYIKELTKEKAMFLQILKMTPRDSSE